jgi:hypothetical protein
VDHFPAEFPEFFQHLVEFGGREGLFTFSFISQPPAGCSPENFRLGNDTGKCRLECDWRQG